jgi:hypothetical protein
MRPFLTHDLLQQIEYDRMPLPFLFVTSAVCSMTGASCRATSFGCNIFLLGTHQVFLVEVLLPFVRVSNHVAGSWTSRAAF